MACASHAMVSPNGWVLASPKPFNRFLRSKFGGCNGGRKLFASIVRASSDDSDCNAEECAPDKEVGKVSVEWLAGDKTKVVGTYPPRKRGWTGYVEKDTAGQTNIYSVEPVVYVAESAISSGSAGSSSEGTENTAAIVAGLALISVAAASSVLLQVGKTPTQPPLTSTEYTGPSLSYYINKFKPAGIIEASVRSQAESPPVVQQESSQTEVSSAQPESQLEISSAPTMSSVS